MLETFDNNYEMLLASIRELTAELDVLEREVKKLEES